MGKKIFIRRNDVTFFHITLTEGTSTNSLTLVGSHVFKGSLQCGKSGDHMNLGVGRYSKGQVLWQEKIYFLGPAR